MASNYDPDFHSPEELVSLYGPLPSWNTWTNRSILKALAGLFLAFPVLSVILSIYSPIVYLDPGYGLIQFCIGLIIWSIFYKMEMDYRRVTPNRIR